jgi:hypothetical protein
MIDNFALGISHGLILLAAWRLIQRPDLNEDEAPRQASAPRWRPFAKDRDGA